MTFAFRELVRHGSRTDSEERFGLYTMLPAGAGFMILGSWLVLVKYRMVQGTSLAPVFVGGALILCAKLGDLWHRFEKRSIR